MEISENRSDPSRFLEKPVTEQPPQKWQSFQAEYVLDMSRWVVQTGSHKWACTQAFVVFSSGTLDPCGSLLNLTIHAQASTTDACTPFFSDGV